MAATEETVTRVHLGVESTPATGENQSLLRPQAAAGRSKRSRSPLGLVRDVAMFAGLTVVFFALLACGVFVGYQAYSYHIGAETSLDVSEWLSSSLKAARHMISGKRTTFDDLPRIHIITIDSPDDDMAYHAWKTYAMTEGFSESQVEEKIVRNTCISWKDWPKNVAMVDYAYKSVYDYWGGKENAMQQPHLYRMYFQRSMEIIDKDGRFVGDKTDVIDSHHLPASLSHIYELQLLLDSDENERIVYESDGYEQSAIAFRDLPELMIHLPHDYDFMILKDHSYVNGKLYTSFRGAEGTKYDIHHWDRVSNKAGIAYLITQKGAKKIMEYMAQNSWDMFDAWVLHQICAGFEGLPRAANCYSVDRA